MFNIMPKKKPKQEQLDKFTVDKNEINIPLSKVDIKPKAIRKQIIVEKRVVDSSNNLLEVFIDNTSNNRKFLELSNNEKNQVIDIGLINKQTFNNKQLAWSNDDWKKKLSLIENINDEEKQKYKKERNCQNEKIKELERTIKTNNNNFSIRMREQENLLKENIQLLYKNDLALKDETNYTLKDEIKELKLEINNQHEKLFEKLKEQQENHKIERNEQEEKHKKEREQLRMEKDSQVLKEIQKMNAKTEVASIKGKLGEKKLMEVLKEYRPEDTFEDVGQKGYKGDIIQNTGKYNIMHESKLYDTQMKKGQVTKFIKDLKNNEDIHAGIMTSFNTHITGKTNQNKSMHFEFQEGKPAFYLPNFSENTETIEFAMRMIVNLLDSNINMKEAEEMARIIKLINNSLQNVTKQEKALITFTKSHDKNMKDIKHNLELTMQLFK
jgi:hypothetical protein